MKIFPIIANSYDLSFKSKNDFVKKLQESLNNELNSDNFTSMTSTQPIVVEKIIINENDKNNTLKKIGTGAGGVGVGAGVNKLVSNKDELSEVEEFDDGDGSEDLDDDFDDFD